jgi:NhaP-type Na+/H+ or K+/H+ antiporter
MSRATELLLASAAFVPTRVFACAVCYGDANSAEAAGLRWAILVLMGCIVGVLIGVARFMIHLQRKALQAESQHRKQQGVGVDGKLSRTS